MLSTDILTGHITDPQAGLVLKKKKMQQTQLRHIKHVPYGRAKRGAGRQK
jgi:hypothetical protein